MRAFQWMGENTMPRWHLAAVLHAHHHGTPARAQVGKFAIPHRETQRIGGIDLDVRLGDVAPRAAPTLPVRVIVCQ